MWVELLPQLPKALQRPEIPQVGGRHLDAQDRRGSVACSDTLQDSSSGAPGMLNAPAPLLSVYGQNGFDEFCINFGEEIVHSYVLRNTFEDAVGYNSHITGDGVSLPAVATCADPTPSSRASGTVRVLEMPLLFSGLRRV